MNASCTCIAAVVLAAAMCVPALADDWGPHRDLRAIRGDLPVLLADPLGEGATVSDVVVDADDALATWAVAGATGIAALHRRSDRWWLRSLFFTQPAPVRATEAPWSVLGVPEALTDLAERHVPSFASVRLLAVPGKARIEAPGLTPIRDTGGGYRATFAYAGTAPPDATLVFHGRAPTQGEMPPAPMVNAFYFFHLQTDAAQSLAFARASIDVWFPFVLAQQERYTLWLGYVTPEIVSLPGTLRNNVLHFDLPAFSLPPGKQALGEIDADER